jgi:hypothetical protein
MAFVIAGPLNAQCGKCLYWERDENVASTGECRRYPPRVVMVREGDGRETASSEWPLTLSTAWCGEWIDEKYRNPPEAPTGGTLTFLAPG